MMRDLTALLSFFALVVAPVFAGDKKLTDDDKIEILRGMMAEYATVKAFLPRSPKPLSFDSGGTWDKEQWIEAGQKYGPAARLGDLVQITKVDIKDDKIVFEINGGMKKKGSWRDHVQIGMGGGIGGGVRPVNTNQSTAPSGTNIALLFNKDIPPITSTELKKILAPVLDFSKQSATENYMDTLPEPVKNAIKEKKAIEGMDRDQVILALGKPRHKERSVDKDGTEMEDWIYGEPPGKITFVTFANSKVTRIKEAYADIGGFTAAPLPAK